MMPYPASGGDADRAAKLREETALEAMGLHKGPAATAAGPERGETRSACESVKAGDDGELPRVWKRYIDSRLKQFCTR